MAIETPLQSVRILPLPSQLEWSQARIPGDTLTSVNLTAQIATTSYAARDYELAYRDIIMMALISETSIEAAELFGIDATRPAVQGVPVGTLAVSGQDLATITYPGGVTHVTTTSRPLDAVSVDRQLYTRDLLLYEALSAVAKLFEDSPVPSLLPGVVPTDAWSQAEGANSRAAVNGNLPLNVNLFKKPDIELAGRDNKVATAIANLAYELNDLYARASRLLVYTVDEDGPRESELYILKSDDDRYRVFVSIPGLEGRNRVIYDKLLRTISWFNESYDGYGPGAFASQTFQVLNNAQYTLKGSKPQYQDAQFWRQKSAQLRITTYRAIPLYYQPNPVVDVSLVSGAVYQPDGVYLPAPGSGVTFVPDIDSPEQANYRLAIYFEPSRTARVFGSLNLNGVTPDGAETATLPTTGFLNWQIKLIEGRYTVRFRFADLNVATENFQVRLLWNNVEIYEGFVLYGQDPGTFIFSNSFVLTADGEIGSFTLERVDTGTGALTVGVVEFINIRDGNLSCKMTATMDDKSSTCLFSSQSGRPDTLFFDFYDTNPGEIQLYLDDVNIGGLYLRSIDVRRFGAQRQTTNTTGYRLWKRTYIKEALESIRRAYTISTGSADPTVFSNALVWTTQSTDDWMNFILVGEERLLDAFRVGRPGDVGQPALTPSGIYYDIGSQQILQLDADDSFPTMQTFQPWMIAAGIYVFNEDFWVEEFDPTISLSGPVGDCDFLTADFTAVEDVYDN